MRLAVPPARRPRIPLTSLVDVVFILLFFFMLASRSADWRGLSLDLSEPAGARAAAPPQQDHAPRILLQAGGALMLDGEAITLEELQQDLSGRGAGAPAVVVPAPGVPVQALIDLLDALTPLGPRLLLSGSGA